MSVTLEDIARKADHSITTISRTLNDCSDVSEEINQFIKCVAQETDCHPHVLLLPNVCEEGTPTPLASSPLSPLLAFATFGVILGMLSHHLGVLLKEVRYLILLS